MCAPASEIDDFPAEHWLHLRTTNPIESTFATVKLRQRVTKGAGSRAAGLAMAFNRPWRPSPTGSAGASSLLVVASATIGEAIAAPTSNRARGGASCGAAG